jgi:hypothetical protein
VTDLSLGHSGAYLTAAAEDAPEPRTAEGILVPWGEPGRTSLGLKSVRRGAVRFTADPVTPGQVKLVGTYGHNNEAAVSRLVAHEDRPEGLWGRLRIADTPAGDLLLREIRSGVRDGLSVELTELTLDPEDPATVTDARIDFVAHVPVGAYDSARVHALAASVTTTGDLVTSPAPAPAAPPAAPAAPAAQDLQTLVASSVAAAMAPLMAQLQVGAHVAPAAPEGPSAASLLGNAPAAPSARSEEDPLREVARLSAAIHQRPGDQQLLAALQDITASGLPLFQEGGGRLGEKLWEGTADTSRQFVDLMAQGELTAMRYYGWEWTELPEMEAWDGDKTTINGNPVALRQVPFDARRCAAGWDVDRKYKDFGDAEFWSEFYTEQVRAYRRLSNKWAAEALVAAALDVTAAGSFADAGTPGPLPVDAKGLVPATGVPEGVTQILKAAAIGRVILENTPRVEQGPDYVLVNAYDWLRLTDLTTLDLPAFLALLKIDPAGFIPTTKVPRNRMVVGVRNAMKYRELPGTGGKGSPIRVEALDIARGGVDSAVFGYVGISTERPGGVLSIPLDDPDATVG